MEKLKEKLDRAGCDDDVLIRAAVSDAIKNSPKSREQIVEEMSFHLGRNVTVPMLNAWTAESRENHRFPLLFLRAFCLAVDDWRLAEAVLKRAGLYVIREWEKKALDIGLRVVAARESEVQAEQMCEAVVQERRSRA